MGAAVPEIEPVDDVAAEVLLGAFKTIAPAERRKHAMVFNYWLSIRRDRQYPPIRDLDPLEISDAGPCSLLLEMIGGGEDADIRHLGHAIKAGVEAEKVNDAPNPSLLACIGAKLPIVAASRQAFAFEDEFTTEHGTTRCWVTLLPFSSTGAWIDFVYGYVSLDPAPDSAAACVEQAPEPVEAVDEPVPAEPEPEPEAAEAEEPAQPDVVPFEPARQFEEVVAEEAPEAEPEPEPEAELKPQAEPEPVEEISEEPAPPAAKDRQPGFSAKLFDALAGVSGFYGNPVKFEAFPTDESVPEVNAPEGKCQAEGSLQNKLAEVRAKADEARAAKIRSNLALYEGLSAAYDFALDAEHEPEDYLKLVEAEGLKIQLRSPMKPVVKLAFDGLCDEATIAQLEAVLAWALKHDLPRGSLAERIQAEGGLGPILNNSAKAA